MPLYRGNRTIPAKLALVFNAHTTEFSPIVTQKRPLKRPPDACPWMSNQSYVTIDNPLTFYVRLEALDQTLQKFGVGNSVLRGIWLRSFSMPDQDQIIYSLSYDIQRRTGYFVSIFSLSNIVPGTATTHQQHLGYIANLECLGATGSASFNKPFQAVDPRDRVVSLLSLARKTGAPGQRLSTLAPNYWRRLWDIYLNVIIHTAQGPESPSWVSRWDLPHSTILSANTVPQNTGGWRTLVEKFNEASKYLRYPDEHHSSKILAAEPHLKVLEQVKGLCSISHSSSGLSRQTAGIRSDKRDAHNESLEYFKRPESATDVGLMQSIPTVLK
ncbi:uncharacterized protein BDR25DRAFT_351180 [Lindgomyces ingoldianus]|uniref:Uncharacterized protein n=1 Tax=Lindgomyces ingoldianus TaxID=673940 RepID=A0ACB6R8K1_9PLEO|nr:uncharacterized protein BDR25DRAFT_351180 [Lindgomyces ingoldianus]KAF2474652.1 hypothetical protein BDR25DRAFT_351180 [Lindgomyces ingoldianus]